MNTEKLTWYVARSGGIVAWLLLALGLILGLVLSSRVLGRRASPAWMLSIHRFLGGLSVIFTGVHVGAIMLDDFVAFGWSDVLIPWASDWNPGAVAWGIIATYLAIAIELTSFAMRRLPKSLWRGVHWLSAPLFVMATVHGYQAGTDAGRAFIAAITAVSIVLAGLTVVRVVRARATSGPRTDPRELLEQAKARRERAGTPPAHAAEPGGAPAWDPTELPAGLQVPDHAHAATTPAEAWTELDQSQPAPVVAASWQDAAGPGPDVAAVSHAADAPTSGDDQPFWTAAPAPSPTPDPDPVAAAPAFPADLADAAPASTSDPTDAAPAFPPDPADAAPASPSDPTDAAPAFPPEPTDAAPAFSSDLPDAAPAFPS